LIIFRRKKLNKKQILYCCSNKNFLAKSSLTRKTKSRNQEIKKTTKSKSISLFWGHFKPVQEYEV